MALLDFRRKIILSSCLLINVLDLVLSQGVFLHPVKKNGKTEIEIIKIEPSLDFDVHNESLFRSEDSARFEFPLTETDVKWLSSLFVFPKRGTVRVRKEYRMLSENEREKFHAALNVLKNDESVSLNKYDLLANIHSRPSTNSAAHGGPAFFGWHRVFLLMMENALRQVDPSVTIPFWDCTLDAAMKNPAHSVIWSHRFLGNGLGYVTDGPFANWTTPFGFGLLRRSISGQRRLINKQDIDTVLKQKYLGNISYPNAKAEQNLEQLHNNVHVWVGGLMKNIEIGAFDPVFYLLHSFVDNIWDYFRVNQELLNVNPNMDYPHFYGRESHAPFSPMGLADLTAIDGISEIWNEEIRYEMKPKCNNILRTCKSMYLKCDNENVECVSKSTDEVETETEIAEEMKESSRQREFKKHNSLSLGVKRDVPNKLVVVTKTLTNNKTRIGSNKQYSKGSSSTDVYKKFGPNNSNRGQARIRTGTSHVSMARSIYSVFQNFRDATFAKATYLFSLFSFQNQSKASSKKS